jgi:hypothetical protein
VATSRVGTFGLLCDVHARIKGVWTQVDCERVDEDGRCSHCLMSAVSHFIDVNPFLLDPLEVGGSRLATDLPPGNALSLM